ncbi:MAG: hypothetical protein QM687_10875 [Ferruginibacter sp.]
MKSLFQVKVNWLALPAFIIFILLVAPGISLPCFIALFIAFFQFLLLFYSYGYIIPVRYLAGSLMCLQMLVGPSFAFMGLDDFQYTKYRMQVSEYDYFSYAIPAVIAFIIGLNLLSELKGEFVQEQKIKDYAKEHPRMAYILIAVGFSTSVVSGFFSTSFDLVFYLLGGFKFIGVFLLLLGGSKLKPLPLTIVFGSIILSSLGSAMFHDLITWLIFLLAVLALKYKPPVLVKTGFALGFVLLIVVIQQLKGVYREATQYQGKEGNLDVFGEVYEEQAGKGGFFDAASLARSNVRINQGFIVSYTMNHVPAREPYANGEELYKILEAAFLPRIIAPNKLMAGDNSLFTKYSGIPIREGTSMSLSALGDGYINFGYAGGTIFMFFLGGLFNFILVRFHKISIKYPIAILFTPLVFYFPIRPDTALQTGLGHLIKGCFLLYMVYIFYKHKFAVRRKQPTKAYFHS